jgi:hypothetical protein
MWLNYMLIAWVVFPGVSSSTSLSEERIKKIQMLLTSSSAVGPVDNLVHLLQVSSDSYAWDMCNPEQLCKVLFRCKMTIGFQIYLQIVGRMTC